MQNNSHKTEEAKPAIAQLHVNMAGMKQQISEALQLLEQAPEGIRERLASQVLECVALSSFEFGSVADRSAGDAGQRLFSYRPLLVGDFERVMAALRAKQFHVI